MINDWIQEYRPQNQDDVFAALLEIMQEITLAGLSRTDFFEKAAFYGGTALRVLYNLDRFSEDLDFSLLEPNQAFSLEPYFQAIIDEFAALGMTVSIQEKSKSNPTNIESAFLKSETIWKELVLEGILEQVGLKSSKTLKIKIEIDRNPPLGFNTSSKLLVRPFSFYVKSFTLPSLFAGKMHAMLFRKWQNRVKGRDWYDMEWYIKKGISIDLQHFLHRAKASNDWVLDEITPNQFRELLVQRINTVSMEAVKDDVVRFIKDDSSLKIWSKNYFMDLSMLLKFE